MKNYFYFNGTKIELSEEQAARIMNSINTAPKMLLEEKAIGDVAKIGEYEFIVLKHNNGTTQLILKDLLEDDVKFGEENNDYRQSNVRKSLNAFADKLSAIVGEDNLIEHVVDLVSDDGLKDYSTIVERVSLLTADKYREFVDILDKNKHDNWWWLATPHSTSRHENDQWVKVVSPSGSIDGSNCVNYRGVRPFCILNSNISVS